MSHSTYRTTPQQLDTMPPGIPYIIGNEVAERFSFYGMRTILVVFMTKYLLDRDGSLAVMSDSDANFWYHNFIVVGYAFPLVGAIASDWLLGKYNTILWLSMVYCLGHLTLALDDTRVGLVLGLSLIAIGMGAIKPCVTSHVGDQFGSLNKHLISRVYGYFYVAINVGAFLSSLLTPVLLEEESFREQLGGVGDFLNSIGLESGPHLAFGLPGVLMAIATFVFWLGRNKFVHVPPRGSSFLKETFTGEGLSIILRMIPIYLCVAAFWCLFDQTSSSWVHQAKHMDLRWLGVNFTPAQMQAINPAFILLFVPIFSYVIYPAVGRVVRLTPLRKLGAGLFLTTFSFVVSALIQRAIDAGETPTFGWQVLAYAILTAAEVMVSITCYEFSYTQAPNSMKSILLSVYMIVSVSLGNEFVAVVNWLNKRGDGSLVLDGENYYWFFSGVMLVAATAYIFIAMNFKERTYIQGESEATAA